MTQLAFLHFSCVVLIVPRPSDNDLPPPRLCEDRSSFSLFAEPRRRAREPRGWSIKAPPYRDGWGGTKAVAQNEEAGVTQILVFGSIYQGGNVGTFI